MKASRRRWLTYWGAWALLGVYMASMDAVQMPSEAPAFFTRWLPLNLIQNLVMGLMGLGLLGLALRFPVEARRPADWPRWGLLLVASCVLALTGLVLIWGLSIPFLDPAGRARTLEFPLKAFRRFFAMYFHVYLLLLWVVLGAHHALRILDLYRRRELETAQLESRLSQAQNQALRMQLQPHFLFNTLNSISALVYSDPAGADRMISRLASLLRMTLDAGAHPTVPLRQELAMVEAYLAIEAVRFQDRLRVTLDVDGTCLDAQVPMFLLQPLVENAIKHGMADLARPSTLGLRAAREAQWLDLEVADDGRGFEAGVEGIGTRNTRARLELMFPGRHVFLRESAPDEGTRVRIRIPWERAAAEPGIA